ncbi:hypothetical protein LTR37_010701 [Vermiconidia calcicola]|uniref:Uncharacterized protein n=1 Tax=Vermiconidia calcicola TaxID=1690605 RepID=A0ACC3N420_9PEZI|nr:hypothetical protein LTR37_010701 [Vermiconidia calcicola]
MEHMEANNLVSQLAAGFETLQDEYQKLFGQHQALERKLATAREQYNELAKLCDSTTLATPPLSLASSPRPRQREATATLDAWEIIDQRIGGTSTDAARTVKAAVTAASSLRQRFPPVTDTSAHAVKIWSGPSADKPEASVSMMPSISESPLEQDFTVEGKPSKLGCPFAGMAGKRLSSHAASVLSRYNPGSPGTALSSVSRVNGRESFASKRSDRRASFADPIKAEICGLSDHDEESPHSERATKEQIVQQQSAEVGVCPIRFLDQHSPEEVATYFERHKHELPRSHEVCVKRYQSNEKQIRELDAKYGNLVSMIQGLGAKHKDMLPTEPDEDQEGAEAEADGVSAEKVRKWASSVSAQAAEPANYDREEEEDRQQHFERPLRDIRVGESPSRPWGIQVPAKFLEEEEGRSERSSRPAEVATPPLGTVGMEPAVSAKKPAGCPFGFDKLQAQPEPTKRQRGQETAKPVFPSADAEPAQTAAQKAVAAEESPRMVLTGPVFIGYSADDAAKILSGRTT